MASDFPALALNDGHTIPQLGLGLYKVPEGSVVDVVTTAIEAGYRHLDTATLYANERGVGEGIRRSGIDRDELFVTTKVWNSDHGFDNTLRAFEHSMDLLGLDLLDLYLIHWPAPTQDRYVETWRALERLQTEGRVNSIGVSNFHPHHLDRLFAETGIVPAVNQIELHPWLPQREARAFHDANGIVTEAWSPLARGGILNNPTLDLIAEKHGVSPAQVVIRWHLQLGNVVIPKSVTPARIAENIDVFGFELDDADLTGIATLASGERTGRDPDDLD
ncbi:aldo/keto reductase [Mycetocola miduiensis]|uniref:2,5-diketo-D-gluconate reductase A n=1 Tax=Mycetocola miduiensis TaxID=995034 RepID=A0A1I5BTM7_9MICO|nr:aldo/keto reductase [Mycetocola miduiensis]SFN77721.1 2,5-diketo-D-gluconate reductase A [Mycetocola miduiensis]